jgi:hypothetical protein
MGYTNLTTGDILITDDIYTYREKVKALIEDGAKLADSEAIKELIDCDIKSKRKKLAKSAKSYSKVENDIIQHNFNKYVMQIPVRSATTNEVTSYITKTVQSSGSNKRYSHAFYPDTRDQKIEFGLSNYVNFSINEKSDLPIEYIQEYFDENFVNSLIDLATTASDSGFAAFYFHYPEKSDNPKLNFIEIDGEELILVYDKETQKILLEVIRYYNVEYEATDGTKNKTCVEIYSSAGVEKWEKLEDNYCFMEYQPLLSISRVRMLSMILSIIIYMNNYSKNLVIYLK